MIKIWCSYHNNKLIKEYNLQNTNIIKLFNTSKVNIKGENINYLNEYLGEFCTLYYVWKNNIKSDIIGFCHYRRMFNKIYYDFINENNVQIFQDSFCEFSKNNIIGNGLNEYLLLNCKDFYDKLNWINNEKGFNCSLKTMFISKWDIFEDICKFIFGYLDFIFDKYNLNWKKNKDIEKFYKLKNYVHLPFGDKFKRYLAIDLEFLIGTYICLKYKTNTFSENFPIIIYNNYNDIDLLNKIYKLNLKTGCKIIFNVSNNIIDIDAHYENIDYNNDNDILSYINHDTIFMNIYNITYDNFIKKLKLLNKNIYCLNNDEYIDCKDSYNFIKGNYKIKKLI